MSLTMAAPLLTKSRFLSGLQCHKRLWLEIHEPLEGGVEHTVVFINGRAVDRVVQTLHPGIVVSRDRGMGPALADTQALLQSGAELLYQPAIRAGDLVVVADLLRRTGKTFELVEVKASTVVKDEHIPDVAFQTHVLRAANILVSKMFIGHVDNSFVLTRAGDYQGLITEQDVTSRLDAVLSAIGTVSALHLKVMGSRQLPAIPMGDHCTAPYECPFMDRCRAESGPAVKYPVNLLPRGGEVVVGLEAEGFRDLTQVPSARLTNDIHQRVHQATVTGIPYFDVAATADLRSLSYPMTYLDFETISMAVPELAGTHPYQQVPFQWSVHVEESATVTRHAEYLAIESFGDFRALAEPLIAAIPPTGSIFAYSASFERGRLHELAGALPDLASPLLSIAARLIDLLPITRAAYYHRDMHGSWSIKSVMPTIAPELDYATLGTVRDGEGAQLAFLELRGNELSSGRRSALAADLLAYCERDTWAMVILRRFLCGQPWQDQPQPNPLSE